MNELDRSEEARPYLQKATEICRDLAEESPTLGARRDLVTVLGRYCDIEQAVNGAKAAMPYAQEATKFSRALAEDNPTFEALRDLVKDLDRLGHLEKSLGRPDAARVYFDEAEVLKYSSYNLR